MTRWNPTLSTPTSLPKVSLKVLVAPLLGILERLASWGEWRAERAALNHLLTYDDDMLRHYGLDRRVLRARLAELVRPIP